MKNIEMSVNIAEKVSKANGVAYYVGGFIRDKLMGLKSKDFDIDIEVHGVSKENLYKILESIGEPINIGKSFGIISLKNYNIDVSMPRTETKVGSLHTDFEVSIDENMGTYNATKRRDFTINSIMQNILTGEIIDHFGGVKDIESKVIRHINDKTFSEDPLRVLRACGFASRFDFKIHETTLSFCKNIDITKLSKERIFLEVVKVFKKSEKPSIFFRELDKINHLSFWFKGLYDSKNLAFNKNITLFDHAMLMLDFASGLKDKVNEPINFMFSVLCNDLVKISGDEKIIISFLERFTDNKKLIKYVENMVNLSGEIEYKSNLKSTNKIFDLALEPNDLIYLYITINLENEYIEIENFLLERLKIYYDIMSKDYITGYDLIDFGIKRGKNFKTIMAYAHNLKLEGVDKETALKQTISYAENLDD